MPFVRVHNQTIHYQWINNRQPQTVVFVNSLGTDFRIWEAVVQGLGGSVNTLRFDKPGHGLSAAPETALTISDYVTMVVALLDTLQIQRCVLVGLSIGGLIGQRLALTHPDRLDQLVLSNTGPRIGHADSWNDRIATVQTQGMAAVSDAVLQRWFPAPFRAAHPNELAGYRAMIEQTSPVGYMRACEAIRDEDLTAQIHAIRVPTLCIGGTDDLATPPELVQAMANHIPDARCELITGAGHIPCVQVPDTVTRLIREFITARPRRDSLHELGMKTRRAVLGDAHVDRAEAAKTDFDSDFQQYITENAWGSIWSRPDLTHRERSLITIALLAALGHQEELAMHIRATRNTGATPDDVKEVLLHTAVYAGVPVTNGAMKLAKAIFYQDTDDSTIH